MVRLAWYNLGVFLLLELIRMLGVSSVLVFLHCFAGCLHFFVLLIFFLVRRFSFFYSLVFIFCLFSVLLFIC